MALLKVLLHTALLHAWCNHMISAVLNACCAALCHFLILSCCFMLSCLVTAVLQCAVMSGLYVIVSLTVLACQCGTLEPCTDRGLHAGWGIQSAVHRPWSTCRVGHTISSVDKDFWQKSNAIAHHQGAMPDAAMWAQLTSWPRVLCHCLAP